MHLDQIRTNLAEHNRAQARTERKPKAKAKKPAAPTFASDDQLRAITTRIVTALGLESSGVTVEDILHHVRNYENNAYQGTVQ
jgi:hypothetical protein